MIDRFRRITCHGNVHVFVDFRWYGASIQSTHYPSQSVPFCFGIVHLHSVILLACLLDLKTDHIFVTWNGTIKIGHLRFAKRVPLEATSVTSDVQLDELNVRWQAPEVVMDNK